MTAAATTQFTGDFTLPRLERVIAGPGTLSRLASELDRYGARAALVVTGPTVGASPLVARVAAQVGDRLTGVFTGSRQHVPASTVTALCAEIQRTGADVLISVGGGSPIDTAKAAAHARLTGEPALLHIAVPTTLSAGEFTDVAGITDDATRVKHAIADTRIAPRSVIADPDVTLATPDVVWAASGIRALDHAVETIYSRRQHPIAEPLASRAIALLREHLPTSLDAGDPARVAHRGHCQLAAWLAVFGVTNAGFGLSHVLGHQIGPRWNVLHGVTSAIVLPHAMRFMADEAPERFGPIATGLGVPFDPCTPRAGARTCVEHVDAFIDRFNLPRRLRDVAVPREGLADVAAFVAGAMGRAGVVPCTVTPSDVHSVLTAAY